MTVSIRPAMLRDRAEVERLVAREAAAGRVLPRRFSADEFLVAEASGRIAGTLSLSAWSADVLELGTVISDLPGHRVGDRLVQAGLAHATRAGHAWAVVLTAIPGYFSRQGFAALDTAPWARARGPVATAGVATELEEAIGHKAAGSCVRCPFLGTCSQALMALPLHRAVRACA